MSHRERSGGRRSPDLKQLNLGETKIAFLQGRLLRLVPQSSYSRPQRNRRGRQAPYSEYLAGIIAKVGPRFVEWSPPGTSITTHLAKLNATSASDSGLQAQGARILSESETNLIVQQDPAFTLHDVLNLPQGE